MMINPLPNNRISKQKNTTYFAIINRFPRINIEDELCSSISCCYYKL
jgi:hypothetical protein